MGKMTKDEVNVSLFDECKQLQTELAKHKAACEAFAVRVLGQERYDNSPCQAHPLELVELAITELAAVARATRAFVTEADRQDLLIGCGRNHPNEREGKYGRAIRKALKKLDWADSLSSART
jgi:hypothetical protein